MPPRAKFTKEEILEAAYQIVRVEGFKGLTARTIAKELKCSPRPLFTTFNSMDEIINGTYRYAYKKYSEFSKLGLKENIPFKGIGTQYIMFAIKEPKLFQALFMHENKEKESFYETFIKTDGYKEVVKLLQDQYHVTEQKASRLYQHLYIYTHGIATMCATGLCVYTSEEISKLLSEEFLSLLKNL